jgi:LmbE family N-acetylglucosaminyl deacetylase
MMEQKCFMAVYAHPDDESFSVAGLFRKYHDAGIKTGLICATRGEQGATSDPALAMPELLGQAREHELRESCRILGVDDLSFLDYRDGMLAEVDEIEAVGRIVYHIRRLRPQVVVTFDANGDYGHLDHIAIHRLTVSAFQKAGDPSCYPEQLRDGLGAHVPCKLYAHAMAWSIMRKVYRQARAEQRSFAPGGCTATIPVAQMGTPDDEITTWIPLSHWQLAAKIAAMRAHRTQLTPDSLFHRFPSGAGREWLETERFKLLYPSATHVREDDLFEGVT